MIYVANNKHTENILEKTECTNDSLINKAEEAKANAPKAPRAPRAPMTKEQKVKMAEGRLAKAQAKLEALLAAENA